MSLSDNEQDCTGIAGSETFYEFRACNKVGSLYVRTQPCVCEACLIDDYNHCTTTKAGASDWCYVTMQPKEKRNPNEKYLQQQENSSFQPMDDNDYEIHEVIGKKIANGKVYYQVSWKGYEETSWIQEELINAAELIEDWEIKHLNGEI